ncbi:MAG: FAD-dependent oxidoreductase [Clostridia bacterium]|nr:FAD-dependent oxidoreductase [Clostridia bacterium]
MSSVLFDIKKSFGCNVFVAGGGVAGIAAAISAARGGANVILADNNGYLGGSATAGMVGTFMTCMDTKGEKQIIKGFFEEFVLELLKENGAIYHTSCPGSDSYSGYRETGHIGVTPYDFEAFKRVAERMCLEAGVKLLYHATLVKADASDGRVRSAYLALKDGIYKIDADVFIDTTGDGALSYLAGAQTMYGDEDGTIQNPTLFCTISGVDKPMLDEYVRNSKNPRERFYMDLIEEGRERGEFPCGTYKLRFFEGLNGYWNVNMAQVDENIDVLDGEVITEAEISQRAQLVEIIKFLRKYIPSLRDIKMVSSAAALGIRESRRVVGNYILTVDDVSNSTDFPDKVVSCANSIDVHCKDRVNYQTRKSEKSYYIPLSCLIVKGFSNLLVAGRCLSADRFALAAVRVMPPCFAMGEAVGVTSALALGVGGDVNRVNVKDVQKILLENNGCLD